MTDSKYPSSSEVLSKENQDIEEYKKRGKDKNRIAIISLLAIVILAFAWLYFITTYTPKWVNFDQNLVANELQNWIRAESKSKDSTISFLSSPEVHNKIIEVVDRVYENGRELDKTTYIVVVILLKIGSGLILFYIINILYSVYRYHTKLSTFYQARYELELLVRGERTPENIDRAMQYLNPINIGFEEIKNPISKQLDEILEKAIKIKKLVSKE